ncbi:protein-tyrosine phosphatase family protein [Aquihabitans daechungensis]|uniref:protein-tyrosine phosphatase family protein n=1 Tax=Aquihabitans daechungensis TaxID=1052257 RepID=UPI003B9EA515
MTTWPHDEIAHAWWVTPSVVLAGEYPTDWHRTPAKLEVLLDAGIRTFVDLTTPDDRLHDYEPMLARIAEERGLDVRHARFPIPDLSVIDVDDYTPIVDFITAETDVGRPVYVHCWGGIGRTGTVIGCWLVRNGRTADEAIAEIADLRAGTRKHRRRSPETDEQVRMIRRWAALHPDRSNDGA